MARHQGETIDTTHIMTEGDLHHEIVMIVACLHRVETSMITLHQGTLVNDHHREIFTIALHQEISVIDHHQHRETLITLARKSFRAKILVMPILTKSMKDIEVQNKNGFHFKVANRTRI